MDGPAGTAAELAVTGGGAGGSGAAFPAGAAGAASAPELASWARLSSAPPAIGVTGGEGASCGGWPNPAGPGPPGAKGGGGPPGPGGPPGRPEAKAWACPPLARPGDMAPSGGPAGEPKPGMEEAMGCGMAPPEGMPPGMPGVGVLGAGALIGAPEWSVMTLPIALLLKPLAPVPVPSIAVASVVMPLLPVVEATGAVLVVRPLLPVPRVVLEVSPTPGPDPVGGPNKPIPLAVLLGGSPSRTPCPVAGLTGSVASLAEPPGVDRSSLVCTSSPPSPNGNGKPSPPAWSFMSPVPKGKGRSDVPAAVLTNSSLEGIWELSGAIFAPLSCNHRWASPSMPKSTNICSVAAMILLMASALCWPDSALASEIRLTASASDSGVFFATRLSMSGL